MLQASPNTKTVIEGDRVLLRSPRKKDSAEFISVNRRSAAFNRGLASPPTQTEEFQAFLKRSKQPDAACFLICRKDDDAIMGSIALSQIFRGGFLSAYLGYQIGAEFARQGFMTEAIQLMLRHAFKFVNTVVFLVGPQNFRSQKAVEKIGGVRIANRLDERGRDRVTYQIRNGVTG